MKPSMKLKLVAQGPTAVAQGEVPVLNLEYGDGRYPESKIATTVNFLRSGCPEVSWLVNPGNSNRPIAEGHEWARWTSNVMDILNDLSNEGEAFGMTWPHDYANKETIVVRFDRRMMK